jgi:hypothetical protein
MVPHAFQIDGQLRPADNIQGMVDDFRWRSIGHRDHDAPFGAGFTGVTSLDTTGKNHGRIKAGDFKLVDMSQRPVVIAPGLEILQCAGRIGFVTFAAGQAGVQQADIDISVYGFRVAEGEVVRHGRGRKALPVDGNFQIVQCLVSRVFWMKRRERFPDRADCASSGRPHRGCRIR